MPQIINALIGGPIVKYVYGGNPIFALIISGVSLLIAALSAEGTSIIHNIEQIERGYQNIDERLLALGANIKRISAEKPSH